MELLAQRQELLTQAISATGEKLEILKSAAEQAQTQLEKGTISQGQFDALQQEVTAIVQSLTNYQGQLGQTSSESSKLQSELQTQENALSENATETQNLANLQLMKQMLSQEVSVCNGISKNWNF